MQVCNHPMGAHTSIQGGVAEAVPRAAALGFGAMQIFTKNNSRWAAPPLRQSEIRLFKERLAASQIVYVVSHNSYLINLCSSSEILLHKSRNAFQEELERCSLLGIPDLNFHPGAHGGKGEDYGINLIAESLNIIHDKTKDVGVNSMLELTAGQGTSLGYRFEQIRDIIKKIEDKSRIRVCIDTAHLFAAGYDFRLPREYQQIMARFNELIGLNRLGCLHMNDSKKPAGSRVDRHDHIGKGYIGTEGFRNIMQDGSIVQIPKILETPKGKEQLEDLVNLKVLLNLC